MCRGLLLWTRPHALNLLSPDKFVLFTTHHSTNHHSHTSLAVQFVRNSAGARGGAIRLNHGAVSGERVPFVIEGSTFVDNMAGAGGADILVSAINDGSAVIRNCTMTSGSASGDGGSVHVTAARGSVNISDTTIIGSTAGGSGGAIYAGAGTSSSSTVVVVLTRTTIVASTASTGNGGGVYLTDGASLAMGDSSSVAFATAPSGSGGGVYVGPGGSSLEMVSGATVSDCSAERGGGVFMLVSSGLAGDPTAAISDCSADGAGGGLAIGQDAINGALSGVVNGGGLVISSNTAGTVG